MTETKDSNPQILTLVKAETDLVVLANDQKEEVKIPQSWLPQSPDPNSNFVLSIKTAEAAKAAASKTAKDILNELLDVA